MLIHPLGRNLGGCETEDSLNSLPTSPTGLTLTQRKEMIKEAYRGFRIQFGCKIVESKAMESLGWGDGDVSPPELALQLNDQLFEAWLEEMYADQSD